MCDVFRKINPCTCHNSKLELQVRCSSALPPYQTRCNSYRKTLLHRLCTDFAPTLVRRINGGRAEEERKQNLVKTKGLVNES